MDQIEIGSLFVIQNALLASRLSKKIGNRLSVHGISLVEYLIMHYLHNSHSKAVSRIELAEHVGMSASGITRLLAPMEKNHLVEKVSNSRDARQSLVNLSETGARVYSEATISFAHVADDLLGNVSQSQLSKVVETYGKLL
jgi:DNA-binding MarR family transcriptional regulator